MIPEQVKANPVLADKAVERIKSTLTANLSWLDHAYGRAWKITRVINGKRYTEPCIFTAKQVGGNGYESVLPSADLGNYSFVLYGDPSTIVSDFGQINQPISIIFWFDLRDCNANNYRDTESLKEDIVKVLVDELYFPFGARLTLTKVSEEPKNVWAGFTIDENDNQFMNHPYSAMRFDAVLTMDLPCALL